MWNIEKSHIERLDAARAVDVFRDVLWAQVRREGWSPADVSISANIHAADGGIDASVLRLGAVSPQSSLLTNSARFQIKAGTSAAPWQPAWVAAELYGTRTPGRFESLGSAVQRCLRENARYVLICFGIDPIDEQIRQACDNYRNAFNECGYAETQVSVLGATQLKGLIEEFPGLCLQLAGHGDANFRSYAEWATARDMQPQLRLSPEGKEFVGSLRDLLRGNEVRHLRLVGEPGIGKSRLALEALGAVDLAPTVVYVADGAEFQRSPLFSRLIRQDDPSTAILVVDDCANADRLSIWNLLSTKSDRIRLVTIDHGVGNAGGFDMRTIRVPAMDGERIAEIIRSYGIDDDSARRWAALCAGSPRIAHMVAQNLRDHPEDVLRNPSMVDVWDRYLVGLDAADSEKVILRRLVLQHVALFERFGFEPPVRSEADYIAFAAAKCDTRLTRSKFDQIVGELKERKILQGVTTLYITPQLLQIFLFREFWNELGRAVSLKSRLDEMPPQLWRWFIAMLRYAHESSVATKAVEQLLDSISLSADAGHAEAERTGELVQTLAEAHPSATLRCLQKSLGRMNSASIVELGNVRQHLVWTLEKIAVWEEHFSAATQLLLILATLETEKDTNNASGTFCSLFSLFPPAPTQTTAAKRFVVLKAAVESASLATRRVGYKACQTTLDNHEHSQWGNSEHQGLRPTISFWKPATNSEFEEEYRRVWRLLVGQISHRMEAERAEVLSAVIKSAWSALHVRGVTEEVVATLEFIAEDASTDIGELSRFVKRQLRSETLTRLPEDCRRRMSELRERLNGTTFTGRLKRFILHTTEEDAIGDTEERSTLVSDNLNRLAKEALANPDLLKNELPWLVEAANWDFAYRLGKGDPTRSIWREILRNYGASSNAQFLCAAGYLAAMFDDNRQEWETAILEAWGNKSLRPFYADLVICSGTSTLVGKRLVELVRKGDIQAVAFIRWSYQGRLKQVDELILCELIEIFMQTGSLRDWSIAVRIFYGYYIFGNSEDVVLPEDFTFRLLTCPSIGERADHELSEYEWNEIAQRFLANYPGRKWDLFAALMYVGQPEHCPLAELDSREGRILTTILKSDPERAWLLITAPLDSVHDRFSYGIRHWLAEGTHRNVGESRGPLQYIPAPTLFEWIDHDVKERGPWVAGALPKTLDNTPGGRLTHDFIAKYHDQQSMMSSLRSHFNSGCTFGPMSEACRRRRDAAQLWKQHATDPAVVNWIDRRISDLTREIEDAEIDEERRF